MTKIKVSIICVFILLLISAPRSLALEANTEPNFNSDITAARQITNSNIEHTLANTSVDSFGGALVVFALFAGLALIRKQ